MTKHITIAALLLTLTFQGLIVLLPTQLAKAHSLSVSLSANPSSGPAPLNNVDLTAIVTGTATGPITYRFDCTSDGAWDREATTSAATFTAVDLCNYPNPGVFTATVRVERGHVSFEGGTGIFVSAGPTLSVTLSADPASGSAPLNNVDLTATVSGTATGPITYRFDCTSDGSFERVVTTNTTSFTALDLCNYPNPGTFTAKVKVERGGLAFEGGAGILVRPPTISVTLTASPSSGQAPLNNVDLTAAVGGTAGGSIIYRFDCTNDGVFDFTATTHSNPFTAVDVCDYPNQGNFTARVRVERQAVSAEATTGITVQAPATLHLSVTTSPSSGHAPLNDVDITAAVSGTATGSIRYRFDCTNDGLFERTLTTSNTSHTEFDLCDYTSPGVYTIRVSAERQALMVEGLVNVVVDTTANLAVNFSANPSSGQAPLNGVDLVAFVSGTAQGPITYRFDCTADGSWDRTVTTTSTSQTAFDLCNYPNPGNFTAKVQVQRGGAQIEGTTMILVF